MAICNNCGKAGAPMAHAFEECKSEFCRHGMTSWFNGDCKCRVEWLEDQLKKRDQLIEQAKPWVSEYLEMKRNYAVVPHELRKWIKDVEELKESNNG